MYPVLFNIGNFPVSSFGLFLSLGIFSGGFVVWRIARGYELDSEKILDLIFLTVGGGFLISRIFYVVLNLNLFDSVTKIFFLNRYPGLSFWGGFLGGLVFLFWLVRKNERVLSFGNKINFFQAGDFAVIGFFIAAFFAEIGCLLGGCGVGFETGVFFGVPQAGVIGKRIPVQFFESLIFLIVFLTFWKKALKFHVQGSLLARGLMFIGIIKLISEFFKSGQNVFRILNFDLNFGYFCSVLVFAAGLRFYYQVYKKTLKEDLISFWKLLSERKTQMHLIANIQKWCYNHWVNLRIKLGRGKKHLFKMLNIKSNPEQF